MKTEFYCHRCSTRKQIEMLADVPGKRNMCISCYKQIKKRNHKPKLTFTKGVEEIDLNVIYLTPSDLAKISNVTIHIVLKDIHDGVITFYRTKRKIFIHPERAEYYVNYRKALQRG